MEDKNQSAAEKDQSVKKANEIINLKKDKIRSIMDSLSPIDDIKIDDVVNKMSANESRQKLKASKAVEIDLAHFIDQFEEASTADMIYDIIAEGLKLDKRNPKKRSSKNFNSILNYIELSNDEKSYLENLVYNEDDHNDGTLPDYFTTKAIRNYWNYLGTERWNINYSYIVNRLSNLENGRSSSKSADITSAVNAVLLGKATKEQISLVESTFPFKGAKGPANNLNQKYKTFLRNGLNRLVRET